MKTPSIILLVCTIIFLLLGGAAILVLFFAKGYFPIVTNTLYSSVEKCPDNTVTFNTNCTGIDLSQPDATYVAVLSNILDYNDINITAMPRNYLNLTINNSFFYYSTLKGKRFEKEGEWKNIDSSNTTGVLDCNASEDYCSNITIFQFSNNTYNYLRFSINFYNYTDVGDIEFAYVRQQIYGYNRVIIILCIVAAGLFVLFLIAFVISCIVTCCCKRDSGSSTEIEMKKRMY